MNAIVLSIGTTHPWNVAGVGRDLVVGYDFGVRVFTTVVAVSAQDSRGVRALHPVPPDAIAAQLETMPWDAAGAVRV
ncbi:MAG: bifunctional hydroxymethylpyrimidine kinase/phosphomethylpyrimidine kinase, partial [Candidatus Cybelea sp.]